MWRSREFYGYELRFIILNQTFCFRKYEVGKYERTKWIILNISFWIYLVQIFSSQVIYWSLFLAFRMLSFLCFFYFDALE